MRCSRRKSPIRTNKYHRWPIKRRDLTWFSRRCHRICRILLSSQHICLRIWRLKWRLATPLCLVTCSKNILAWSISLQMVGMDLLMNQAHRHRRRVREWMWMVVIKRIAHLKLILGHHRVRIWEYPLAPKTKKPLETFNKHRFKNRIRVNVSVKFLKTFSMT